MPPKKQATDKKKMKEITKVVEDKTFGMKNKNKSNVVKKMVKGMTSTAVKGGVDGFVNHEFEERKAKKAQEEELKFLASIKLGDINACAKQTQKNGVTIDPKSQICPYFKAGLCQKGRKCKFSHDKGGDSGNVKASLYQDIRGDEGKDDMQNWDQKKLEEAVNFNQNKYVNPNATDKICNSFLDAIEMKKYGWFWVCPNGHNCKYKHSLPLGFVLKTGEKEEKFEFDIERDIDRAREELQEKGKGTEVTYERYLDWREKRRNRKGKEAELKKLDEIKKAGIKVQKNKKILSGRALFVYNPTLFQDADDAVASDMLKDNTQEMTEEDKQTGKTWESKKVVEEIPQDIEINKNGEIKEESENEGEEIEVNEDAFADEEELPDDL